MKKLIFAFIVLVAAGVSGCQLTGNEGDITPGEPIIYQTGGGEGDPDEQPCHPSVCSGQN